MRGQTAIPVFFRFGLRATFFLHTKKEGKDVPRGFPPWNPQAACRFSHHENRRQRYHLNHPIQIGAAALGL